MPVALAGADDDVMASDRRRGALADIRIELRRGGAQLTVRSIVAG